MRAILAFLFVVTTVTAATAIAGATGWQPTTLPPVDEGESDASFRAFRQSLLQAIRQRDDAHLLSVLDAEVRVDLGGGFGIETFVETWRPHDPSSPLWPELELIVSHGGGFVDAGGARIFCAPYVSSGWPALDAYDGFGAIIEADVALRDAPSEDGRVVRRLEHDVVRAVDRFRPTREPTGVPDGWTRVELADGTRGFVRSSAFRSPIDQRACFRQTPEGWRLRSFVAGD